MTTKTELEAHTQFLLCQKANLWRMMATAAIADGFYALGAALSNEATRQENFAKSYTNNQPQEAA